MVLPGSEAGKTFLCPCTLKSREHARRSVQISLWMKRFCGRSALTGTGRGCCETWWWNVLFINPLHQAENTLHTTDVLTQGAWETLWITCQDKCESFLGWERSRLIKRKETAQHQRDVYLSNREQHSTSWCMWFRAEIRTLVSFCLSEQKSHFEKFWWGEIIVVCNCVNKPSYAVAELGSELYLNNCCISK